MIKHKQITKIIRTPTVQAIAAIVLFVSAVLASRGAAMHDWEIDVFRVVYDLPTLLQPFFFVVTQLGSVYGLALALLITFIMREHRIVLRLLLTSTLAYLLSGFAKSIWGRARPNDLLSGVINRDHYVQGPGFPSGHTALIVALAFTIGHYLPKKYHWLVTLTIVLVGLSRMYMGVHAPLDIVGGFAIGWFSYALFRHVRILNIRRPKQKTAKPTPKRR